MEEYDRLRLENEHLHRVMGSLLVEKKNLTEIIEKQEEIQFGEDTLEKIVVLAQNYSLKKRGAKIVRDVISAAGVLESEAQTQPAYPMRQLEQVVHYSYPQNSQQASESLRGT